MLQTDDVEDFEKAMDRLVRQPDCDPDIKAMWEAYCRDYNYMRFGEPDED